MLVNFLILIFVTPNDVRKTIFLTKLSNGHERIKTINEIIKNTLVFPLNNNINIAMLFCQRIIEHTCFKFYNFCLGLSDQFIF